MKREYCILWLKIASVVTILTGLISALGSFPATAEPWRLLFDLVSWPLDGNPVSFSREARALNAVLGGVMVGWGWLMFQLVAGPLAGGSKKTGRMMLRSILLWFLVDSIGSFAADLPGNILLNAGFLLVLVPPLLLLEKMQA